MIPLNYRHGVPWMLWWIVGVHVSWGVGLHYQPMILNRIVALIGLDWLHNFGLGAGNISAVLLLFSMLAATGLTSERFLYRRYGGRTVLWVEAVTLCPQYFLVLIAFLSDLNTLIAGTVSTQTELVDRWVLLCVLGPVAWGAFLHTGAILERAAFAIRAPAGERGEWVMIWSRVSA